MWVYSVDFLFSFFFNLATPLGMLDISSQPGVKPEAAPALEARSQPLDIQEVPILLISFQKPLLLSLHPHSYTQTHTHRHIHTEPPSPPYSSSSFCQLAYLHPSIEYINPSFWLQFFNSTFISPLFLLIQTHAILYLFLISLPCQQNVSVMFIRTDCLFTTSVKTKPPQTTIQIWSKTN